jgi:16S rRNA (guanine527-N7)-methyltransferase
MRAEFVAALTANQEAFGIELSEPAVSRLADYFDLVQENNPLLHLVGPCSDEEFAVRHILESLTILEYLPQKARFADVGAGAGLPSIPCLLAREDLSALLIETKEKKAKFLETALEKLGLDRRASVINLQFDEIEPNRCEFVTCRALDKFTERLPRLLKWAKARKLLLFGGENLASALRELGRQFEQRLTPLSEKRFLFIVRPLQKE